jgi:phage anti-repressor protein
MTDNSKLPKLTTVEVIKLFTNVPEGFAEDFFSLYDKKHVGKDDYIIDVEKLAKWLEVTKKNLLRTLRLSYTTNIDYIEIKAPKPNQTSKGGNNYKKVMLTPDCMKRICMRSTSNKAETVRTYFIEIENFLIHYNDQIVEGIMRDIQDLARKNIAEKRNDGPGVIYILRADKASSNLNKIGQTGMELIQRLRTYNTGRAQDVEVLSVYRTEYRMEVERCIKKLMKEKQFKKRREIYHVNWEIIQKLIAGCAQLSMKLHGVSRNSVMDGEYYIIFKSDIPNAK